MKNVTTCNLSSWGKNAWKKSGLSGFEPGPLRSWYSTLTNYAVAKACLHFHQILKKFEVMPFLDNFFCYYFILLTSFLFISHSLLGLVEKINEFHPLAPRDLVKRGRKMYIHNGMFYHAKDQFYPVVRKLKQPSQLRFSYKNALITCNTLLDDQDVIELSVCYNNVIFPIHCTGIEKNYSQKILIPLRLHWTTLQVVVSTICWNCWNYKDPNKWATQP